MKKRLMTLAFIPMICALSQSANATWNVKGQFSLTHGDNGVDYISCNGSGVCGTLNKIGPNWYFKHEKRQWTVTLLNIVMPDPDSNTFEEEVEELFSGNVEMVEIIEP